MKDEKNASIFDTALQIEILKLLQFESADASFSFDHRALKVRKRAMNTGSLSFRNCGACLSTVTP